MTGPPVSPDRPASALDGKALLADTAELGEYFSLRNAEGAPVYALSLLFSDDAVMDFVHRTRAAIAVAGGCTPGDIPLKVAASSFQLGVAARLVSPVIGAAVCFGAVPMLDRQSVGWYPAGDHSPRFAMTDGHWVTAATPSAAADLISATLLTVVFTPLHERLRSLTALSSKVTWGNVISAANGAVTVLASSQPHREGPGRALVRALAATPRLADTATFADDVLTRRSCCLFYLAPASGYCGDCVLVAPEAPGSRR